MQSNTTAHGNVAVGYQALNDANRTADGSAFNVAIGHLAGNTGSNDITTGDQNVLIGYNTAASVLTASNQIVIGAGASGTANNAIALGNTSISSIKGQVDFSTYSDARIKKDIRNSDLGLALLIC